MRAAKARAAERGESLKTLFERAVAAELGRSAPVSNRRGFPVIPSKRERVDFTNEELEDILAADDIDHIAP